jgi:hypothetical protein
MSSEEKIVPITRGERRPKQQECFAVIVGRTRVDVGIEPAQLIRRRPAAVVELVNPQGHTDGTPSAPASTPSNEPRESNQ